MTTTAAERTAEPYATPAAGGVLWDKFHWSRLLKVGGACAVLGLGAYAVSSDIASIVTDNAVVTAYAVPLRTPIDGTVTESVRRIGDHVDRGDVVADVSNIRVDDQRLVDLREHLARARASVDSITAAQASLRAIQSDLEQRSKAYLKASAARLAGAVTEAELTLAAAVAKRDEAQRILARRSSLVKSGFTSIADLDSAQSNFDVASHQVDALQGRLDSLRVQQQSIDQGVVSEPGSSDVAYSRQREDEVTIRLSELDRERALAEADLNETQARLQSEEQRVARLRSAAMTSPITGMIWKLDAQDGERLGTGETVAQVVDCDQTFIIATLPQNRFSDVAVGSRAKYRLSGDVIERYGRVASITGDATAGDRNLAALPIAAKGPTITARVMPDSSSEECLVGRTARVLFPSSGRRFTEHLFDRFR